MQVWVVCKGQEDSKKVELVFATLEAAMGSYPQASWKRTEEEYTYGWSDTEGITHHLSIAPFKVLDEPLIHVLVEPQPVAETLDEEELAPAPVDE